MVRLTRTNDIQYIAVSWNDEYNIYMCKYLNILAPTGTNHQLRTLVSNIIIYCKYYVYFGVYLHIFCGYILCIHISYACVRFNYPNWEMKPQEQDDKKKKKWLSNKRFVWLFHLFWFYFKASTCVVIWPSSNYTIR